MFLLGNFIEGLAKVLDMFLTIYIWIIVIRALISWVNPDPYNPIVQFLYRVTEPVLRPIRRWLPFRNIGIDFSPIVVIAVIIFIQTFVVQSLIQLAFRLKPEMLRIRETEKGAVLESGCCRVPPVRNCRGPGRGAENKTHRSSSGRQGEQRVRPFISDLLKIKKSAVSIIAGEKSKNKTILISGIKAKDVEKAICRLTSEPLPLWGVKVKNQ